MIDNITASDIANEISMLRSAFKGTVLVVEGITDSRLYSKFIDKNGAKVVIAYSKDNVRHSVAECSGKRNDQKILGIIDADIDHLTGKMYSPPIFVTDERDLETTILRTSALDDVLTEYADQDALSQFEKRFGKVRDVIARSSYPIGLLMYISVRDGIGLSFKDLEYYNFIDKKTLAIDVKRMVDDIFMHSSSKSIGKKELIDRIESEEELLDDPWIAARGHDAVFILLIGFVNIFGSYNCCSMNAGKLGGALRLAFGYDDFRETDLYKYTLQWSMKYNFTLWMDRC